MTNTQSNNVQFDNQNIITDVQKSRNASLSGTSGTETYEGMQKNLISDLTKAGVPQKYIDQLLEESNKYYGGLYKKMKDELEKTGMTGEAAQKKLTEIFGNFVYE